MSKRARPWGWLLVLLAVGATLAWQLAAAPPREQREIAQERWSHATPPLSPAYHVGQSFVAQNDGLQAIVVLAARYGADEPLPTNARMRLTLERLDHPERTPIVIDLPLAGVSNNQPLRFAFPPQQDSGSGLYRLTLSTPEDYGLGVWLSREEALAQGTLFENDVPAEGDLLFSTYHSYPLGQLLRDLPDILAPWLGLLATALAALTLPGLALLAWLPPRCRVNAGLFAAWLLALGLSFWPLLLLWSTTLGLPLSARAAWVILGALAMGAVAGQWRGRARNRPLRLAPLGWPEIALATLLGVAVVVRLIQARAQIVPVWVDSVHHTMVTQLIVEQGLVPRTGEPYIAISGFHYHFGFHASAAVISWLAGIPSYRSVLGFGQLLSGLAGLPLYALTTQALAGRRMRPPLPARWAGVVAAAVPSFLTYMPAYYLSWGRYTQLAGLLILPVSLAYTWALWERYTLRDNASRRGPHSEEARTWIVLLLLIAGLALTHYRVLAFYVVFWGICLLVHLARRLVRHPGSRAWAPLGAGLGLAAGALLLIAPWGVRLLEGALLPFGEIYGQWAAPEGSDTSLPMGLLRAEGTPTILVVASLGWLWAVLRRRWRLALLGGWAAACVAISDPSWLGLPGTWFLHGTSVAISYWLPAGVLIGWLVSDVALGPIGWLRTRPAKRKLALGLSAALLTGLVGASVGSVWQQIDRVNESTVLVRESDLPAIAWVRQNLPADSLILINTRPWQEGIPMGSDAGWWLPYLTGHRVTYPAVLYTHGEPSYRAPIAALAQEVQTAESLDDPALLRLLAQKGVTHVFVGTRGGPLEPQRLAEPHYVELYRYGPTRVYRFQPFGETN